MVKKVSPQTRRAMLAYAEAGLSLAELKKKHGIRDTRTVKRHLGLAEREREEREARVQLLKESLGAHLDEVRQLLQEWQQCFSVRPIRDIFGAGPDQLEPAEGQPLFGGLRRHVPDRELWASHRAFKDGMLAYLNKAAWLREQTRARISEMSGLRVVDHIQDVGVFVTYGDTAFELAAKIVQGDEREERLDQLYYQYPVGQPEVDLWALQVDARVVLSARGGALGHREKHLNLVRQLASGEEMADLLKSYLALCQLADRVRARIRLALLRREYILYRCELCPGQVGK